MKRIENYDDFKKIWDAVIPVDQPFSGRKIAQKLIEECGLSPWKGDLGAMSKKQYTGENNPYIAIADCMEFGTDAQCRLAAFRQIRRLYNGIAPK